MREEIYRRVQDAGHSGFTRATFPLWRFEGLEGRQPSDIARTSGLSKQAVNDQLGALERLGYLKRTPHSGDGRARVVRLTERGRELDRVVRTAAQDVEGAWSDELGEDAWRHFRDVLDRIAAHGYTRAGPAAPTA